MSTGTVLHLDLKPSNVVNERGQAKLIDFSIARPPGRARGSIGTRVYMAPEQSGGVLTAATDVWGIGACSTRRLPATVRTASHSGANAGSRLRRLWMRLEPDPNARPSIAELAARLDAYA